MRRLSDLRADLPLQVPVIGDEGAAVIESPTATAVGSACPNARARPSALQHFTDKQLIAKVDACC